MKLSEECGECKVHGHSPECTCGGSGVIEIEDRVLDGYVTIKVWMAVVRDYFDHESVGGSCRVWIDEGTTTSEAVKSCFEIAIEKGDTVGAFIAAMGLKMTQRERDLIEAREWPFAEWK